MTEPGTGSDLAGMRTTAVRDGDDWIVNGAKTFITGGMQADLVIVVARTSTDPDNRRKGLTLLVVEDGMPGFTRGRELEKMGCKVQDTAELSFVDVRVPAANVLGRGGRGVRLPRPQPAAGAADRRGRFGVAGSLGDRGGHRLHQEPQGVRHARSRRSRTPSSNWPRARRRSRPPRRCSTGRSRCTSTGELSGADAARVKLFCTEMQQRVVDRCLQLFGGYGYMMEYPIARLYTDARVARIYAGTSEVMKVIIAKSLGL